MPAKPLDGRALADGILARLKAESPGAVLGVLWSGDDPSSASYRRGLAKACSKAGMALVEKPTDAAGFLRALDGLNRDAKVSAILVQTPFPPGIDPALVARAIDPEKDAEGVSPASLGLFFKGDASRAPATARAAVALAKASGIDLKGAEAVVVGKSGIVGKPAALLLVEEHATVTICRRATRDLAAHTRRADVLVAAAGSRGLVTAAMVKPGAVVVDVGIHAVGGKVFGDVDPGAAAVAGWLTPVPGGVGPATVAMILERAARCALVRRR